MTVKKSLVVMVLAALSPLALAACGGGDSVAATATKGDAFCKLAKKADQAGDSFREVAGSGNADDIKDASDDALKTAQAAAAKAPKDIADTIKIVIAGQVSFVKLLKNNDYDFAKLAADEDYVTLSEDTDFSDAGDELDTYLDDNCGIAQDDGGGATETTAAGGTDTTAAGGPDTTAPVGTETTGPIVLGSSGVKANQFLDFYALGAGVTITDEMRSCFVEKTSKLSDDDFDKLLSGDTSSDDLTFVLGSAILTCDIPVSAGG